MTRPPWIGAPGPIPAALTGPVRPDPIGPPPPPPKPSVPFATQPSKPDPEPGAPRPVPGKYRRLEMRWAAVLFLGAALLASSVGALVALRGWS